MPTWEQAHLCLIRDVGIFWLLRNSVPLCLLGDSSPLCLLPACAGIWASSGSLGTGTPSASSACLGTWASPGCLGMRLFLPAQGHEGLLTTQEQDRLCLLGHMATFSCLGTGMLSAYCLAAREHGHPLDPWRLDHFPLPGDRILENHLGPKGFLLAQGHGHLLGHRILLCFPGDMGIIWLLRDRVLFACSGTQTLSPVWGQEPPLPETSPVSLGTRSHSHAWGQDLALHTWGQDHFCLLKDISISWILEDRGPGQAPPVAPSWMGVPFVGHHVPQRDLLKSPGLATTLRWLPGLLV